MSNDVFVYFNPCNMLAFIGISGLLYMFRIRNKHEIKIGSRVVREYTILAGKPLVQYRRFYVAGCILFIVTGTLINPFYDFVPSFISLSGVVAGFICLTAVAIITHRYGVKKIRKSTYLNEELDEF